MDSLGQIRQCRNPLTLNILSSPALTPTLTKSSQKFKPQKAPGLPQLMSAGRVRTSLLPLPQTVLADIFGEDAETVIYVIYCNFSRL